MKRTLSLLAAGLFLFGTAAVPTVFAAPKNKMLSGPQEATGCLQQGPSAREYLLQSTDGTTWGVYESGDLLLNNYVGHTVTVAGDSAAASKAKAEDGATRHMKARDIVVDAQSCQK